MKTFILAILLLGVPSLGFAIAPDIRLSDCHGHVADITTDGKLNVSTVADSGSCLPVSAPDRRISDNDSQVVDITASGQLRLSS